MKPAIADRFRQINACLEELRGRVLNADEQLQALADSRDELQKKTWSQSREIHVMKEQLDEFPEIKRMCEHYREMSAEFEKRLRDVLGYTRALAAAFRE